MGEANSEELRLGPGDSWELLGETEGVPSLDVPLTSTPMPTARSTKTATSSAARTLIPAKSPYSNQLDLVTREFTGKNHTNVVLAQHSGKRRLGEVVSNYTCPYRWR